MFVKTCTCSPSDHIQVLYSLLELLVPLNPSYCLVFHLIHLSICIGIFGKTRLLLCSVALLKIRSLMFFVHTSLKNSEAKAATKISLSLLSA
ncbi:hypothetical protein K7X08_032627 [Anisodus acutangulus]|uniref:Uncharacterized protein n=1 Tax=Anisodus acutangulus TaxID=402998 RepID=A0A9Q1R9L2_9SOLA|nr:hypothetical protein K7X08_032627 [Anisodus acutangulus]